jgi:phosphoserine aminotransferase
VCVEVVSKVLQYTKSVEHGSLYNTRPLIFVNVFSNFVFDFSTVVIFWLKNHCDPSKLCPL